MRVARLLPYIALALIAASAVAGTARAAAAINPSQAPAQHIYSPFYPVRFDNHAQLFARIVADRDLGKWFDESLLQRIQADSRIDRIHDRSPEPIEVVRVDLRNPDGTSRVRSGNGDFPFYVLRQTPKGLVLLGQMFGSDYRSSIRNQHLEFQVEQHVAGNRTVKMHFRVDDNVLVNLSAPKQKWRPSVTNGIARR